MRRNKTESIGDLVRQYLRQEGLETPLNEVRMVEAWAEVMGQAVARYTGDVFVPEAMLGVQTGEYFTDLTAANSPQNRYNPRIYQRR